MEDRYLGDGVYASFDGYQIWLDTRGQYPVHKIALEPAVFAGLLDYYNNLEEIIMEATKDGLKE
jgi:hypothetical protein